MSKDLDEGLQAFLDANSDEDLSPKFSRKKKRIGKRKKSKEKEKPSTTTTTRKKGTLADFLLKANKKLEKTLPKERKEWGPSKEKTIKPTESGFEDTVERIESNDFVEMRTANFDNDDYMKMENSLDDDFEDLDIDQEIAALEDDSPEKNRDSLEDSVPISKYKSLKDSLAEYDFQKKTLKAQNDNLYEENENLRKELENLQSTLKDTSLHKGVLEEDLSESRIHIKEKDVALEETQKKLKQTVGQVSKYEQEIKVLRESFQKLEKENKKIKSSFESSGNKKEAGLLKEKNLENERLQKQLEEVQRYYEETLKQNRKKLEEKQKEFEIQHLGKNEVNDKEREEMRVTMEKERHEFRNSLRKERQKWEEEKKRNEELQNRHRRQVEELNRELKEKKKDFENESLLNQSKVEENVQRQFERQVSILKEESGLYEGKYKDQLNRNKLLQEQLDEILDSKQKLTKKYTDLQEQFVQVKSQVNILKDENIHLHEKIKAINQADDMNSSTNSIPKSQVEKMLAATQEDNKRLLEQLKAAETKNKQLTTEIQSRNEVHTLQRSENIPISDDKLRKTIHRLEKSLEEEKRLSNTDTERLKRTMNRLRDEKQELELEISNLKKKHLLREREIYAEFENQMKANEMKQNSMIDQMNSKLRWYIENQQILDKQDDLVKSQKLRIDKLISENEELHRQLKSSAMSSNGRQTKQIQELKAELKEARSKLENPNRLSQLIKATKSEDSMQTKQLKRENDLLKKELKDAHEERDRSIRIIKRKTDELQMKHEDQVRDLKRKLEEKKDKISALKKKLDSNDLSGSVHKLKNEQMANEDRIRHLEQKLREKNDQISRMESIKLVPQPFNDSIDFQDTQKAQEWKAKYKELNEELIAERKYFKDQVENERSFYAEQTKALQNRNEEYQQQIQQLKEQVSNIAEKESKWTAREQAVKSEKEQQLNSMKDQIRKLESRIESIQLSKEDALKEARSRTSEAQLELSEFKLLHEKKLIEIRKQHEDQIDILEQRLKEEQDLRKPDVRDQMRQRKLENILQRINDMESKSKIKEMEWKREMNEMKFQHELDLSQAKQSYDLMLRKKNAEVTKFKIALDQMVSDLKQYHQLHRQKK